MAAHLTVNVQLDPTVQELVDAVIDASRKHFEASAALLRVAECAARLVPSNVRVSSAPCSSGNTHFLDKLSESLRDGLSLATERGVALEQDIGLKKEGA